jgi:hypothetical protein
MELLAALWLPGSPLAQRLSRQTKAVPLERDASSIHHRLASGVPSSTPISGTPLPVGVAPTGMAIDDSGSLLAVDNSNLGVNPGTISLFTIGAGGALTAQPAVNAGDSPQFVNFFNLP